MADIHKLRFRICKAPRNEIFKKPYMAKTKHTVSCTMKEGTSIAHPHFIVKSFDNYYAYNYCYSYDFHRDYFIDDIICLPQGQLEIVCSVDVLYSFRNAIGNLVVHEERSTNGQSNLLQDSQVPIMYNEVFKERYDMQMEVGSEFGVYREPNMHILTYYTSSYASPDGNEDENKTTPLPKGYYAGANMSALACRVAENIRNKALEYYKKRDALVKEMKEKYALHDKSTAYSCNICYSQNTSDPMREGSYKNFFNLDNSASFTPCRYDTPDQSELNVTKNGVSYGTNLHYTPNYIGTDLIPQAVKDAGCKWYAWDCVQFAWRCCMFGTSYFPIDIGSDSLGSGFDLYTAGSAKYMLSKYVTYSLGQKDTTQPAVSVTRNLFIDAESVDDIKAGDIIISGQISTERGGKWWLVRGDYDSQTERYTYVSLSKLASEPRIPDETTRVAVQNRIRNMAGYSNFTIAKPSDIVFINHAMVYVGDGNCIETTNMNTYTALPTGNQIDVQTNALKYRNLPELEKKEDFWGLRGKENNTDYHYLVFRPALLAQDGQTVPYSEWYELENT